MTPRDLSPARPPAEPWLSFLTDLDAALDAPTDFHCIGGFFVSQHYGFARETADLDVLTVIPPEVAVRVASLAGMGSPLQSKHRVYIDHVSIATHPDDYPSMPMSRASSKSFHSGQTSASGRSNRTTSRLPS